jgi:hypothetical protein
VLPTRKSTRKLWKPSPPRRPSRLGNPLVAADRSHVGLPSVAVGPNLNRLVCDGAWRAAHVLLSRLPVDLMLADLTQIDE